MACAALCRALSASSPVRLRVCSILSSTFSGALSRCNSSSPLVLGDFDAEALRHRRDHLQDARHLVLGEQAHVQVELGAALGDG